MNAVEIEEAISQLAEQTFDREEFAFQFLEAFGNKATTIKRLKSGSTNSSDIEGGVLQRNNIHIAVCAEGEVGATLGKLKDSAATAKGKAKYILATDGVTLEAEDLISGETVACDHADFPNHFGFFLSLAGISTVKQIRNNPIDIQATGRLNRLYVELLKTNEDWSTDERRHDMNQFMARLIFCFFAEDTDIFDGENMFTTTVERMSNSCSGNIDHVLGELYRAMDTRPEDRANANLPRWADAFPWVNGGLFEGCKDIPKFSRIARSYLLHAGRLDWKEINPDIFGSMIQAVADDEERGELGMHYTSVPNILKVLNPLFLDDLRGQLEKAGDNPRKLLNLRKRMAAIRVFDPACGSGNFLVIAYIQMREIEMEILRRRGDVSESGYANQPSWIKLENFYGIEIKDFAVEVARLSLLIAEFQCDVKYIGQKQARALVLPLRKTGQIYQGNALRMNWLEVCPPTSAGVKTHADDLFQTPLDQGEIDLDNRGGEAFICGNPPYKGSQTQTKEQKSDLAAVFDSYGISSKQIDYVGGWFMKAATFAKTTETDAAFVSTNSVCQGRIVPILWPRIFETGAIIRFAHTSFKWANLASHNAGVTVAVIGLTRDKSKRRYVFDLDGEVGTTVREARNITPYLTIGENIVVDSRRTSVSHLHSMSFGNMPVDGGNLLLSAGEVGDLNLTETQKEQYVRRIYGSAEFIRGIVRFCLWIEDTQLQSALDIESIKKRIDSVRAMRLASKDSGTREMAIRSHQFREMNNSEHHTLILPGVSSEGRAYLPIGILDNRSAVTNLAFALYDAPLWNMALIASRMHLVWIATVCGKLKTDFRYSNTLGWNTFPVPSLTEQNKADLTHRAEDILLAREAHFPATIADLYDPDNMPEDLRHAHERNDEVLERIYIGRRFKNDTERLEKLFKMYTAMTNAEHDKNGAKKRPARKKNSRKVN